MKQYLSKFLFGCFGLCIGFALCYFAFVRTDTASNPIVVTIANGGTLYLGGSKTDLSKLTVSLKRQAAVRQEISILIDPQNNAELVNAVFDACKACGVTQLSAHILPMD